MMSKFIGLVSAYAYAKSKGYTGTEEEFAILMAEIASVAETAVEAERIATESAQSAAAASSDVNRAAATVAQQAAQVHDDAETSSENATTASEAKETAVDKALDSEAWALGTRDGEDVGSQDETYHNNAKYYAESVSASAQTATEAAQTATTKASEAQASASAAAESARTLTIDATLTQSGQPADAKETGDKIGAVDVVVNGVISKNYTEGKYFSDASGAIADNSNTCISDFIPVTGGNIVTFYYTDDSADTTQYRLNIYDANKEFIASYARAATTNKRSITLWDNAVYARFCFKKGFAGRLTTQQGANIYLATDTVESNGLVQNVGDLNDLGTSDKSSVISAINEVKGSIPDFPVEPKDTTFFHASGNLVNPDTIVTGEFVNQTNGAFVINAIHCRTDYVSVKPNTKYCIRFAVDTDTAQIRYAFYDINKTFISGALTALGDINYIVESPSNAVYIVVSVGSTKALFMVKASAEKTDFAAYGDDYILPKYIVTEDNAIINIPSKIYALVGYELNIYFENITEEWEKYKWDVTCSKGMQLERGYRITPVAGDVGTYALTIKASLSDTISKEVTTTLVVTSASAGTSATKSVIVLGDSTTNNGIAITKLNENFSADVMGVSTLGTRGTAPNNHEGRSGWGLETYFTVESADYTDGRGHVENPFYNPTTKTFDADYYFTNSGIAKPDWFVINMGINDVFNYKTGAALDSAIETCIGYVDSMVTSVKSASPSSKIGICLTIPPNHSQDAFGKAYSNGQTRYRYKKNNTIWVNRLIAEYDNRESEGIYLIPIHTNLDTVYNMGMETLPVNARNTAVTYQSPISNGGVHPVESGYWQIADVYTAFLKANV